MVLERRPQAAVSHEVRRRGQRASRGAPGKSMSGAGSGRAPLVPAWVAGVSPTPEGEPAGWGERTKG